MRARAVAVALVATLAVTACGDSFSPSLETVAGTYTASTLTTTTGGVSTDQLGLGGTLTITLAANGTTTGHLFVPGGGENGEDLSADLAGAWSIAGNQVTFAQTADTFIRDMTFAATKDELTGDETFAAVRVQVGLHRGS